MRWSERSEQIILIGVDQVWPRVKGIQSTGSIDLIHPDPLNLGNKYFWYKNFTIATSKSNIVRTKQMELLISCFNTLSKVQRRKRRFKWRTLKSFTVWSYHWLKYLIFYQVTSPHFIKSLHTKELLFSSYTNSGTPFKAR